MSKTCQDCQAPMKYGEGFSSVCHSCRGKRSARAIKAKRERHGPEYFNGRRKTYPTEVGRDD